MLEGQAIILVYLFWTNKCSIPLIAYVDLDAKQFCYVATRYLAIRLGNYEKIKDME